MSPASGSGVYRYQPPKSSIWGHRLRRMPAGRAQERLERFLELAVARYTLGPGQLVVHGEEPSLDALLAESVEMSTLGSGSYQLTSEGAARAVAALARWEGEHPGRPAPVHLVRSYVIEAWRIDGRPVATKSMLTMHYGALPCLSTFLEFGSVEEFERIGAVFAEVGLCKLNPKHLKAPRARRVKPAS